MGVMYLIYGIGDLHLDYSKEKPMDIFGTNWENHEERIFNNWKEVVGEEDLVLLPGDISWALKINGAYYDLKRIDELPGEKIITKGNHDFWWEGPKKLKELNLNTIFFMQNNHYIYKNIGISGTRGWIAEDIEDFNEQDRKVFNREIHRLELSLKSLEDKVDKKIVMIHYPPFNMDSTPNKFVEIMLKHNVDICIYGHLHGDGHKFIKEGNISGIQFYCTSSDYINFIPKKIL